MKLYYDREKLVLMIHGQWGEGEESPSLDFIAFSRGSAQGQIFSNEPECTTLAVHRGESGTQTALICSPFRGHREDSPESS